MNCTCGYNGHPSKQLNARGQLVDTCPVCQREDADDVAQAPQVVRTAADERLRAIPSPTTQPRTFDVSTTRPALAASGDILSLARQRRDALRAEIARLEGLRAEAKQLDKMIAAAERARPKLRAVPMTGNAPRVAAGE